MVTCVKVTNQNYVTFEVKLSSRQSPKVQILTAQTAKDYSEKKNRSKLPKNAKKKKRNLTQIVLCCLKVLFYFFPFLPLNSLVFDTPKRQSGSAEFTKSGNFLHFYDFLPTIFGLFTFLSITTRL